MSIYESAEDYAGRLNMTVEQAQVRIDYFKKAKEDMKESQKCPKCGKHALTVDSGEYETGTPYFIYCGNDNVQVTDEQGHTRYVECDFIDEAKKEYIFVYEHDFDAVLMMAQGLDITNEEAVINFIGETWEDFVRRDTETLRDEPKGI